MFFVSLINEIIMKSQKPFLKIHSGRTRKKNIFIFAIIVLSILSLASLASFLLFGIQTEEKSEEVILEINGEKEIASGEEINYLITIENRERVALKNVGINLKFPLGFYWKSSNPTSLNPLHTVYQWPELKSKEKEKLEIKGQLIGQTGEEKELEVVLIYRPTNFRSNLEKEASFVTKINLSTLEIEINGPEKSLAKGEVDYEIGLKNVSKIPLGKIKASLIFPPDLEIKEIKPNPEEGKNIWILEKLEPKEEKEIKIKGKFSGNQGQQEELKVQAGILTEEGFVLQAEKSLITSLFEPKLSLDFTVNDQKVSVANWEETLNYLVKFKNENSLEMGDVEFKIQKSIDPYEIEIGNNQWEMKEKKWNIEIENVKSIPVLTSLKPNEEGEIIFKIILPKIPRQEEKNVVLENKIEATVSFPETGNQKIKFQSNPTLVKIQSKVDFRAEARYYNNDYQAIGSGPLPPKVGQETVYHIYWHLSNTTNVLKNIKVKTKLPQGINFFQDFSQETSDQNAKKGNLDFISATREVVWYLDEIQPWVSIKIGFQISLIPSPEEIGKILALTGPTTLEAQDQFTKTNISLEQLALLSDLIFDPIAKGKGVVEY